MQAADEEAIRAFHGLYEALDDLLRGKGTGKMRDIWHHGDYVTSSHPFGDWARGWAEVWATWEEAAAVWSVYRGHDGRSDRIGGIHGLRVSVLGDTAYGTSIFHSKLHMSEGELDLKVNCTDIVHRIEGVWKVVHHHPDQAPPSWSARIGQMVQLGHS
jgi:ketosteroid isomerase-like protein